MSFSMGTLFSELQAQAHRLGNFARTELLLTVAVSEAEGSSMSQAVTASRVDQKPVPGELEMPTLLLPASPWAELPQ